MHNNTYLEIMDKFEKEYQNDPVQGDIYDDMYYYDQMNNQQQYYAELQGLDPQQRIAQIQQMRAIAAANGGINEEDFDSEDDAMFFDNNDLANRIWDDAELENE